MFKVRTTMPKTWNKLYNNYNNGGLSLCINGRPTHPLNNVLANCVGYACSRFNEIYNELTKNKTMKFSYLNCNAEDFWKRAKENGLDRGQIPKAGAIMVWEGLGSLAGHVAIVERVNSLDEVYTSESGYGSASYFWNAVRYYGGGNWGANGNYRFLGFIYNPAVKDPKRYQFDTSSGKASKRFVRYLQLYFHTTPDGVISNQKREHKELMPRFTRASVQYKKNPTQGSPLVKQIQKWAGVKRDGWMGPKTIKAIQRKLNLPETGVLKAADIRRWKKWLNKRI